MAGSQTEIALREIRSDLAELGRRAEQLELELVASLIRMAVLDIEAVLKDSAGTHLDS